jgi:prepilin-type N-terminal cleavage/methylation domain-containing protein
MIHKRSAVSNQQVNPPSPPLLKGGKGGFEDGFTLIELMITMVAFVLVIASISSIFLGLVNQFKQQSKIAETNIEGITGLEILRQDIEHAGYGLPWIIPAGVTYSEASSAPASTYNDASNPPRAILSGNDTGFNNSDYLVIKSINVARNYACSKWTTLQTTGTRVWVPNKENVNFNDTDGTVNNNVRVIVLYPGSTESNSRNLIVGTTFSTPYSNVTSSTWSPTDPTETRIIYGVDPDTDLRMPFNRADYFILNTNPINVPIRCAPNTGVLVKAVVPHDDGNFLDGTGDIMPLLDCVADMQVIYRRDTNDDGIIDNTTDDISALSAQQIREQVKEVRIYILAHEGQRDVNYTYPNNSVTVGEFGLEKNFDLTSIANYQNYRWKVYTIVVNSNNLR